jgi:hypothetical protein
MGVARFDTNGQIDPSFDPGDGPTGLVSAVAVQADGKVVIGGAFTSVAGRGDLCGHGFGSNRIPPPDQACDAAELID